MKTAGEIQAIADRLEADMRRYLYDKTPERRIQCLTAFQERMGYDTWLQRQTRESLHSRLQIVQNAKDNNVGGEEQDA